MVTEKMIEAAVVEMMRQDVTFANCDSGWQKRVLKRVIEAALSTDAEPSAWKGVGSDGVSELTDRQDIADQWRADGIEVTPLYAAPPQPAPSVAVKALTLDALKHYFECLNAGDFSWSEMPTSLYTYLLMDGYVSNESARHEVRAALSAQVQVVAIPEGWQLVPKIATVEMETAALEKVRPYHDISDQDWRSKMPKDLFRLAWPSMLAAAPDAKLEGKP